MTAAPRSSDDPSSDGPPPDTPSATSSPSRTLRIELAYDGGDYAGWQIQPGQPTVQAALEASFAELAGQRVPVVGSGRTDAGVHALAQVASCRTTLALPCRDIARALNARLPDDIIVRQVSDAPADFSALHSAKRKRYAYLIHNRPLGDVFLRRYAWHVHAPLDLEAMQRAAGAFLGTHDFSSFESSGSPRASSVRTIDELTVSPTPHPFAAWAGSTGASRPFAALADEALICISVSADGFLYNMVRAIVGTLVEVGRGAECADWPAQVVAATDRSQAGPTAPPQGLFLVGVEYDGQDDYDDQDLEA
ncbi:MAG: tRNA pseudouridine(38-40) synthase TruA [Planctomycetales bacterium]|nr:tRNA pseudouridine(38-40) synthase TruA [Planctomycetales bacterium]